MKHETLTETMEPAERRGFEDALRGITANPYGQPHAAQMWREGYAAAEDVGLAELPAFYTLTKPRRKR